VGARARGRNGCPLIRPVRRGIRNSRRRTRERGTRPLTNRVPLARRAVGSSPPRRDRQEGITRIRNDEKHQRAPDRQRATCNFVGRANVETFADLRGRYMTEYPRHLKKIERARSAVERDSAAPGQTNVVLRSL